jgi:hypothetical protein
MKDVKIPKPRQVCDIESSLQFNRLSSFHMVIITLFIRALSLFGQTAAPRRLAREHHRGGLWAVRDEGR